MTTRCGRIVRSALTLARAHRRQQFALGGSCHAQSVGVPCIAAGRKSLAFEALEGHWRTQIFSFSDKATPQDEKETQSEMKVTVNIEHEPDDEDSSESEVSEKTEDDTIDRSKFTHEVKVRMPDLGEAAEDYGKVVKWYKKEGNIIRRGETLCDIETQLFTFGMDTDDECTAVMGTILVPAGSDPVEPGEVLCIILHEEQGNAGERESSE